MPPEARWLGELCATWMEHAPGQGLPYWILSSVRKIDQDAPACRGQRTGRPAIVYPPGAIRNRSHDRGGFATARGTQSSAIMENAGMPGPVRNPGPGKTRREAVPPESEPAK